MRKLFVVLLMSLFAMATQTSHAAKIAYMHNTTAPNAGDNLIIGQLRAIGHTVSLIPEATAAADIATSVSACDMFYISSSISSGSSRGKNIETLTKPIINSEQANQLTLATANGPFGFGASGNAIRDEAQIFIDAAHAASPFAANMINSVTLFSTQTGSGIPSCVVGTGANAPLFSLPIANAPTYSCIIVIDANGKLADGSTSPNKRIESHVTAENAALVTPAGWRLFIAQVQWCLGLPMPDLPATASPTSVSALTLKNQALYTSITLTNPNNNPLVVNALKITGAGSSVFTIDSPKTLPMSVAGLTNGTVVVKSLLTADGTSTGTLQIGYNNSASTITIPLNVKTVTINKAWLHQDIGGPTLAGNGLLASNTFTLTASGADIWNAADQFHYMYQYADGNYVAVAKVATLTSTTAALNAWAKSGVMIRETTDANSKFVNVVVSATSGIAMQYRAATGAAAASVGATIAGVKAPVWVKVERFGNTFSGYYSTDGANWNGFGSTIIPMNPTLTAGLCLTSHDNAQLVNSTYTNVSLAPPVNAVSSWVHFE